MARLGPTIKSLGRYRDQWVKLAESAAMPQHSPLASRPGRLKEETGFGSNPGGLRMLTYVPQGLSASAPLVVVLHGCGQTAEGYDYGAGWSALADHYGFALLFPEQQRANNPNTCFNWFRRSDSQRGKGEPLSIRQMIERMVAAHDVDRRRIFVTGLSAGGAMTSIMLATYPELFAGGAIVAGLPYGAAASVEEAFESMFQGRVRPAREWGDLVRGASSHTGPWPTLSVWHGSADATVKAVNADEIIKQWTDVHGLPAEPAGSDVVDGHSRKIWRDAAGREVIESFTITSMAHGTPLAPGDGENEYGVAGPYLLDVGISSTYHIAKFWGLTGTVVRPASTDVAVVSPGGVVEMSRARAQADTRQRAKPRDKAAGDLVTEIQSVIDNALRAAGLKS